MAHFSTLPYKPDQLDERKELFKRMDPNSNFYLSLAEIDAVLTRDYVYDDISADDVNSAMLHAFTKAKDFGGEGRECEEDYVEHREFRIFLELFVNNLTGAEGDVDGTLESMKDED
mmetsp:Transcript_3126/g.7498  ORF Transcript_3126/g.7498 Transcript_3126/m.7498 type:complete len:116 (+) Transcript_3126:68-415(+)|eukprot:CAMPEP_0115245224 /NCGR_PEP_ID=MMETSP0270-20121206/40401_1 /TAXON_ID=71861 /ORGANISM="Scrippsiella trochoidea, Strain CCMP3099" /LENGTH=115 /DNA_ID=CAMNT_0002660401 /DNA_START=71 /DNA_END=418 /DNA_ORIENTATION=+